ERRPHLPPQPLPADRALGADHGPVGCQWLRAGRDRDRLPHPRACQCLRPALRAGQPGAVAHRRHDGGGGDRELVRLRRGCRGAGRRRAGLDQRHRARRLRRPAGARCRGPQLARPRPAPRRGRCRRGGRV
ncbi:MAG: FIG00687303: hypothetical protein, partial [uncultured Craurococcus sp.]